MISKQVTIFGKNGYIVAAWSTGTAIEMVKACLEGKIKRGYALCMPPGHHAEPERGRGFCIFSNTAIAAQWAISQGLKKVATVDFDVHHGNGAQKAFFSRKDILTISIHQDRAFKSSLARVESLFQNSSLPILGLLKSEEKAKVMASTSTCPSLQVQAIPSTIWSLTMWWCQLWKLTSPT